MDPAFVKKEASWHKASLPYDNLSRLPPESLSKSNPAFKEALHNYYFTTEDGELKSTQTANDYCDPWPVKEKPGRKKKREPTPEDEDSEELTAGIPPKDREAFNAELRSFMEENCPSESKEELPDPIVKKTTKAAKAKKAIVSREKRAAAKIRSTMPPPPHTRNTRLKAAQAAEAAEAAAAPDVQGPDGDAAATQNATAVAAAPEADEDQGRSRQHSAPPFNSFMRDTRAAMNRNAYMSRPVRGAVSNAYYAAYNSIYPKPRSVGDEPVGNDIPSAPADVQEPAAAEPEASNTVAPKNPAVPKKSTAQKPAASKTPAPKKSAAPKPAAPKPAGPKPAALEPAAPKTTASKSAVPKKSAATETATSKAASTKPANGSRGKDKSEAVKLPRAAKACDPCRSHKTRCTGGTPCDACRRRGFDCVYAPDGRKAPVKRAREESEDVVKKEPLDKDDDQESRPAKRPCKLKLTFKKKDSANGSDNAAGTTSARLSSVVSGIEEVPEGNIPNGPKSTKKRAREDDQEAVEKAPADEDTEQGSRPTKRARKVKVTSTKEKSTHENLTQEGSSKKRAREENEEAVTASSDKGAEQESRPAKRPCKPRATATKKSTKKDSTDKNPPKNGSTEEDTINKESTNKDATHVSDSTADAVNGQPSSILPSIEEVPEDHEELNAQPLNVQQFSQRKTGKNTAVKPTKMQSSYSGRITRSRSRQLSEEAEAQPAKLQHKGKRAREETEDPQEPPAKLQRSSDKSPIRRKVAGNPKILRAIDSMRVDAEGSALTDDPWDNYPWEPTWMSNTYLNWEKSFHYPDLNLQTKSQEESFHARPSIKLVMTDVLKGILVDDWEHVTKDSQLVPLPHEQPVVKILNDYLDDEMPKREEDSAQIDILKETMAGLREYFDRALGRILLYRFERLQYSELLPQWENEKDGGPSSVYGGEHLCRLLVSLPELLAQTNMDQQSVSRLREELTKFTNWLSKNGQKYFVREYEVPGPEYQDKAKSS